MIPSTVSAMHARLRRGLALAVVPVALVVAACGAHPPDGSGRRRRLHRRRHALDAPLDRVKVHVGVTTAGENAVTIPPRRSSRRRHEGRQGQPPPRAPGRRARRPGRLARRAGRHGRHARARRALRRAGPVREEPARGKVLPLLMVQSGQHASRRPVRLAQARHGPGVRGAARRAWARCPAGPQPRRRAQEPRSARSSSSSSRRRA